MIVAMLFSFAACSSKTTDDTDTSTTLAEGETTAVAGDNNETEAQGDDSNASVSQQGGLQATTTTKPAATTTTKEETTTKRSIVLTVKYPYSVYGQKVTITYKQKNEKDDKYRELIKDELINIDQGTYEIKEELIGDVDIHVTITGGIPLMRNYFVVSGKDANSTIEIVTSSEQMDGGMD